ncbi:TonB-dependent siderophore receptor [Herbaspirillum autotrophicum]|uniref:TonB-dependent siderophore receptor n=1 Tax=Herbaspirillum autotrophicum TaxID=180195 RepID=UPI000B152CC4|nr:TonB-dependent siderophore receptor [Herbaspirillum autotrophicum]
MALHRPAVFTPPPRHRQHVIARRTTMACAVAGVTVALACNVQAQAPEATVASPGLPPVHVNAGHKNANTEGTASYTTNSMNTASKLALPIRDTPQSVSVITRQRMDDQGMTNLNDVVKYTPGLILQKYGSERQRFFARGFQIDNIMYDGLPTSISTYTQDVISSADTAMYDRVEIVRGATGLMQGAGNPAAAINLVRKRPAMTPQLSLSGSLGSWDNYRAEVDASNRLNASGSLRGRGVAAYQDKGSFQDKVFKKQSVLYGMLEADLTSSTTLSVGASIQNDRNRADWGGLPTARNGNDLHLPRATFLSNDWAKWNKQNTFLFGELEQRFDNGWKLRLTANRVLANLDLLGTYLTPAGSSGFAQNHGGFRYTDDQNSLDIYATGPFQLLGRQHELVVGASDRREKFNGTGDFGSNGTLVNVHDWNSSLVPPPALNYANWHSASDAKQQGAYASARFNLSNPLKLILGTRLDRYDFSSQSVSRGISNSSGYKITQHLTRYAGLMYDLNDTYAVYASYTDIFKPQGLRDRNDKILKPIVGSNKEIGIKGQYFDGTLNASLALFQINQNNRAKRMDLTVCPNPLKPCFEASGEVESVGLDMEVSGALTANWQMQAGYTYVDARYRQDAVGSNIGALFEPATPAHLLKLSASYRLPANLERWRIGGSVSAQSDTYKVNGSGANSIHVKQGAYTLFDLMLSYQMTANAELRLNINNLFDKRYYQNLGSNSFANVYGDPRNILLTAKWSM